MILRPSPLRWDLRRAVVTSQQVRRDQLQLAPLVLLVGRVLLR